MEKNVNGSPIVQGPGFDAILKKWQAQEKNGTQASANIKQNAPGWFDSIKGFFSRITNFEKKAPEIVIDPNNNNNNPTVITKKKKNKWKLNKNLEDSQSIKTDNPGNHSKIKVGCCPIHVGDKINGISFACLKNKKCCACPSNGMKFVKGVGRGAFYTVDVLTKPEIAIPLAVGIALFYFSYQGYTKINEAELNAQNGLASIDQLLNNGVRLLNQTLNKAPTDLVAALNDAIFKVKTAAEIVANEPQKIGVDSANNLFKAIELVANNFVDFANQFNPAPFHPFGPPIPDVTLPRLSLTSLVNIKNLTVPPIDLSAITRLLPADIEFFKDTFNQPVKEVLYPAKVTTYFMAAFGGLCCLSPIKKVASYMWDKIRPVEKIKNEKVRKSLEKTKCIWNHFKVFFRPDVAVPISVGAFLMFASLYIQFAAEQAQESKNNALLPVDAKISEGFGQWNNMTDQFFGTIKAATAAGVDDVNGKITKTLFDFLNDVFFLGTLICVEGVVLINNGVINPINSGFGKNLPTLSTLICAVNPNLPARLDIVPDPLSNLDNRLIIPTDFISLSNLVGPPVDEYIKLLHAISRFLLITGGSTAAYGVLRYLFNILSLHIKEKAGVKIKLEMNENNNVEEIYIENPSEDVRLLFTTSSEDSHRTSPSRKVKVKKGEGKKISPKRLNFVDSEMDIELQKV